MKRWMVMFALSAGVSVCAMASDWNGYVVDQTCASKEPMWSNSECVARCVRRGSPVVLVTADGTVYKIANQDKVKSESYGKKVTVTGTMEGDTITVENVKM
jgi:hypothetical protein